MIISPAEVQALTGAAELEQPLSDVEARLRALGDALREGDSTKIDAEAAALHRCLAAAIDRFGRAAKAGSVPAALRQRLAVAGGQVAAHREALARATASLDRAIDVLLPAHSGTVYGAAGNAERPPSLGELHA